jgi:hypothetical protein
VAVDVEEPPREQRRETDGQDVADAVSDDGQHYDAGRYANIESDAV